METERNSRFTAPDQVWFTDSGAIVINSEFKLALFLKQTTPSFPYFEVNRLTDLIYKLAPVH